jgi:hypothetical protein
MEVLVSETYRFFDGTGAAPTDRPYVSDDLNQTLFKLFQLTNGVLKGQGNNLAVTAPGGLIAAVNTGVATYNGMEYENSASLSLSIPAVTTGYTRIDQIVIRFDRATLRTAQATLVQGTAVTIGNTPSIPTINAYDIAVGYVWTTNTSGTYSYAVTSNTAYRPVFWNDSNDGAGSGCDADLLDGQQGSYYLNGANISGTVATAGYATSSGSATFASLSGYLDAAISRNYGVDSGPVTYTLPDLVIGHWCPYSAYGTTDGLGGQNAAITVHLPATGVYMYAYSYITNVASVPTFFGSGSNIAIGTVSFQGSNGSGTITGYYKRYS